MKLNWIQKEVSGITYYEAETPAGTFSLNFEPTNNIRGPWRLLIERKNEFIDAEIRRYHDLENAKEEAALINDAVMIAERAHEKRQPSTC